MVPYGVNNLGTGSQADARENWWGHASGPGGNGPGTGDKVSEKVLFSPWDTSMAGVSIAGPSDTIIIPSGVPDSILLFFQNWISMSDTLECSISDSLGWLTNPPTQSTFLFPIQPGQFGPLEFFLSQLTPPKSIP